MLLSFAGILTALMALGVAGVLVWFAYSLIFRRVYRVRHLRQLEMDRLIREAAARPAAPDPEQK